MNGAHSVARVSLAALAASLALVITVSGQALERVIYVSAYEADSYTPLTDVPDPRDIIVREDGVQREVLRVTRATEPMPIAVLVDNSAASTAAIADIRGALTTFVETAGGLGPIALISVADRPTVLADYTTNRDDLMAAINRIFAVPGSGTTLLDGIVDTARGLSKRESERAAIVLLAAENTEFSNAHYSRVLEVLDDSGAALHAVVWTRTAESVFDERAQSRAVVFDRGVRESGGLRLNVLSSQAYEGRMKELATVLTNQFRVVYARPETLVPPRQLEVTMGRAGVEARATPARGQKGG